MTWLKRLLRSLLIIKTLSCRTAQKGEVMQEEWRDVVGYEGHYQVSSLGRVKSLERVVYRGNGEPNPVRERILRTF